MVENIFKHGYISAGENDPVSIEIRVEEHFVGIYTNNSIGRSPTGKSNQTGLKNMKERLYFAYGKDFSLSYGTKGNRFEVSLEIPVSAYS
ncbi:MAG: hypothetical protein EOO07_35245 [Chitinophagaceae bacterium]|nr:MAG: hypothetical protein EOO07_35245 [Chitinophagaceae bacterium]